jgi:esterase/lipase superfamily enzyme
MTRLLWVLALFCACFSLSAATLSPRAEATNSYVSPATWRAQRTPGFLFEAGLVQRDEDAADDVDPLAPGTTLQSWTDTDSSRGVPKPIEAATLAALGRMISGYAEISGLQLEISGSARPQDSADIIRTLSEKLPKNYRLIADLQSAERTKYAFSAFLGDDGVVELSGSVPDIKARERIVAAAGHVQDADSENGVFDRLRIRSDAPNGFADAAVLGLAQLRSLDSGVISLEGQRIDLFGTARNFRWNAYETCAKLLRYLPRGFTCGFLDLKVLQDHHHPRHCHHLAKKSSLGDGSGSAAPRPVPPQPFPVVNPASLRPAQLSQDDSDPRVVDLLFATGRSADLNTALPEFTGERGAKLIYGQVRIRIPERHDVGRIELPGGFSAFWLNLIGGTPDPKNNFIIRSRQIMAEDSWNDLIDEIRPDDALIFVHGFNTTFDDAAFQLAQIVWDLQYNRQGAFKGLPVLYSWPSRGEVLDYNYDRESALGARDGFMALLRNLRERHHIGRVHVLAHSMGNFLTLDALAAAAGSGSPVNISDLIMAAPDVDRNQFIQEIPKIEPICARLTLYASAADKALAASKAFAGGIPRAGDVPGSGPIILSGLDTIDVTAMGDDMFGMNHSVFAQARELLDDMALLLIEGHRPPRLATERGIPEGSTTPDYWRYAP